MWLRGLRLARPLSLCLIIPLLTQAAPPETAAQSVAGITYVAPKGWTVTPTTSTDRRGFEAPETELAKQAKLILLVQDAPGATDLEARQTFDRLAASILKDFKVIRQADVGSSPAGNALLIQQATIVDGKDGVHGYIDVATLNFKDKLVAYILVANSPASFEKYRPAFAQALADTKIDPLAPVPAPLVPPAKGPANDPAAPVAPTPADPRAPVAPPDGSDKIVRNPDGTLAVAQKNGLPFDGVKLSQYNVDVISPSIAVASDGVIHVAFAETNNTNHFALYHRSSADAGATWTPPENLSDAMPNWAVGNCKVVCDSGGRTYVLWRTGIREGFSAPQEEYVGDQQNNHTNIVYRVLERGAWSKPLPLNTPATPENSYNGPLQWFPGIDADGNAQVLWNASPVALHPELRNHASVYPGVIWQASLNGATLAQPKPIYAAPVIKNPKDPNGGKICDGFGVMTAYFARGGAAHVLAEVQNAESPIKHPVFQLVEDGKQIPALDGAGQSREIWRFPPVILVDAHGRRHVIAIQSQAEHAHVRDYLLGSNEQPKVIRSAGATLQGMQACQGPGGRMAVFMQMNDSGEVGESNLYVSTSDGGAWDPPIDVTNNTARNAAKTRPVGLVSNATIITHYTAGPTAGAFDRQGHLVIVMINNAVSLGTMTTAGWITAQSNSSVPTLMFLRL